MTPFHARPSADGLWTGLRSVAGTELAIVVADGMLRWIGALDALPAAHRGLPLHEGGGALVTPG
ncbi:MAG: imidazolonepropionase, partial [Comamonadaceae bacterium]